LAQGIFYCSIQYFSRAKVFQTYFCTSKADPTNLSGIDAFSKNVEAFPKGQLINLQGCLSCKLPLLCHYIVQSAFDCICAAVAARQAADQAQRHLYILNGKSQTQNFYTRSNSRTEHPRTERLHQIFGTRSLLQATDKLLTALKRHVWEEGDDGNNVGESSSIEGFTVKLERATAFHYDKVLRKTTYFCMQGACRKGDCIVIILSQVCAKRNALN